MKTCYAVEKSSKYAMLLKKNTKYYKEIHHNLLSGVHYISEQKLNRCIYINIYNCCLKIQRLLYIGIGYVLILL